MVKGATDQNQSETLIVGKLPIEEHPDNPQNKNHDHVKNPFPQEHIH